jgi:diguanylate cyclase (GGDEF)-like protein
MVSNTSAQQVDLPASIPPPRPTGAPRERALNTEVARKLLEQSGQGPLAGVPMSDAWLQGLIDAGLANRRSFELALAREIDRVARSGEPALLLTLDIDHFKRVNDTHGHAAGDAMLAAIGHSLQAATRSEDLACRYGGEEFTVVLVEAAPEDALRRAEQIRASIAATTVQHLKRTLGPCTASIGLAMLPSDGLTPTELLEAADQALYRAKSEGRDRVVAATRPALSELSSSTSRA